MMSHKPPSGQNFEILCDSSLTDNPAIKDNPVAVSPQSQPLGHLSISQSQNRQLQTVGLGSSIRELGQVPRRPHWKVIQKNNKEKCAGGRLTRPPIAFDTFEVLHSVTEPKSQTQSVDAASSALENAQRVLQLPVDRYSSHPLSSAALNIPPVEEQLEKHRDGLFEWILAIRIPSDPKSQRNTGAGTEDSTAVRKVYFGCNLLPALSPGEIGALKVARPAGSYSLLITPLEETNDVLEVFHGPVQGSSTVQDSSMALVEANPGHITPVQTLDYGSMRGADGSTPNSTLCSRGDETLEPLISGSPGNLVIKIEDSFEALDILEDQLEAFDIVARFNQFIPTEKPSSAKEPTVKSQPATPTLSVRFATPQPQRTFAQPNSATLRVKSATEPRRTALRKSTSMTLDVHKFKPENKPMMKPPSKASSIRGTMSSPQRIVAKSRNQPTIPTYELPGETVSRQLKEKKEARLASQRATQPTAASLRRAKSAKPPTRPTFELPGEAISRRKREEHQAQLKTQEEEDKKRREFKARPLPSQATPATVPRGTIASRARQSKAACTENSAHKTTPTTRPFTTITSHTRPALLSTINQTQPRGRGPTAERASVPQTIRATSTSTASMSGKHSSLSTEDVQMQKLRGHEIYVRDNSLTDSRMRERQERESLAKLAREEAAERSRQKSREWAAKQAKKRVTAGSP
ncbi:hypothetical protein F4802DRAFT_580628 [Xylaria palmicola]|nr:hypothetical protein F4802DRAFT_580628 [Xylaria palmicola]